MNANLTHPGRRVKLTIEYDGTDFAGWQFQPECRTVQGEIERAFQKLYAQKIKVYGAGRTDSGVHAAGQVAHVTLPDARITNEQVQKAINSTTGYDLHLTDVETVSDDFHARFMAVERTYTYRLIREPHPLQRRYALYPRFQWDDKLILPVVRLLSGCHSFKSFCRQRPGEDLYVCVIKHVAWISDSGGSKFNITANRFFHQMIRGLTGALMDVGRGKLDADGFIELLENPVNNAVVNFAPPHGLVLESVSYNSPEI